MNKFFILLCAALVTTIFANAQTSSGNMMVGGTLEFSSTSRQGGSFNDGTSITFSPSFGYFIQDNLVVGSSLTLSSSRIGTGADKTINSSFGLGPFARYYKFTSNENFAFFGQAGLSFAFEKTDPSAGGVTKSNSITFSVAPGAAYFFNQHWAIELAITGFVFRSSDPDTSNNNDKVNTVELGLSSFSPTFGFRYHF